MKVMILISVFQVLLLLQNCKPAETVPELEVISSEISFKKNDEGINLAYYGDKPFTGIIYTEYPDGKRFVQKSFVKGLEEGKWDIFYPNGNKMKTGNIVNGVKEGIVYEWWENGNQKNKQPFKNGKKHGTWEAWYENGAKQTTRDFDNDMLNGKVIVWDSLGKLTKEYQYKNGQMVNRDYHSSKEGQMPEMPHIEK